MNPNCAYAIHLHAAVLSIRCHHRLSLLRQKYRDINWMDGQILIVHDPEQVSCFSIRRRGANIWIHDGSYSAEVAVVGDDQIVHGGQNNVVEDDLLNGFGIIVHLGQVGGVLWLIETIELI